MASSSDEKFLEIIKFDASSLLLLLSMVVLYQDILPQLPQMGHMVSDFAHVHWYLYKGPVLVNMNPRFLNPSPWTQLRTKALDLGKMFWYSFTIRHPLYMANQ